MTMTTEGPVLTITEQIPAHGHQIVRKARFTVEINGKPLTDADREVRRFTRRQDAIAAGHWAIAEEVA